MTAATALALAVAGFALTGAPDWRARLTGAVLCMVAGWLVCARYTTTDSDTRHDVTTGG
jgi:hypothetical protein